MKKNTMFLLMLLSVSVTALFAQTNTTTLPGVPTDLVGYWDLVIAAVSPLIVTGVAKLVPHVPKLVLPSITPLVGIGVGLALNKLAGANLSWYDMGKAGALAVFVREVINQAITKRLASEVPAGNDTP
jgi:hypothetical protein